MSAASFQQLPITEQIPEIAALSDATLDPLFWPAIRIGTVSAWWGHVPFAFWLMSVTRPRLLVELGTHGGVSYSAFCEAVIRERIDTNCFAVDTWEGDEHSGFYGSDVYGDFRAFHDERYGAFSGTLRSTFDEAVSKFDDGSIDLLHIDGLHTLNAVQHDFEAWSSKLSDRAVLLAHDTNEREGEFGVWKFWSDLSNRYPTFEFFHGHGLGVAAIGNEASPIISSLCRMSSPQAKARVRERFAGLGERWVCNMRERQNHRDLGIRDGKIAGLEQSLAQDKGQAELRSEELRLLITAQEAERKEAEAQRQSAEAGKAQAEAGKAQAEAEKAQAEAGKAQAEAEKAQAEAERRRAELEGERERERTARAKRDVRAEAQARIELKEKLDKTNARLLRERDAARNEAAQLRREMEAAALRLTVSEEAGRTEAENTAKEEVRTVPSGPRNRSPRQRAGTDLRHYSNLVRLMATLHWQEFREYRELKRSADRIRSSALFDADWYEQQYPDVAASGLDPAFHYLRYGAVDGRNPSSAFDGGWYLQKHSDVAAGMNPLLHYVALGAAEGRETRPLNVQEAVDSGTDEWLQQLKQLSDSPLFDGQWYLQQNRDVAEAGLDPVLHYLRAGAAEGRSPGPYFDGKSYLQRYPDVAAAGLNPLLHYIQWGQDEGREPSPVFLSSEDKVLITNVDQLAEARYPALKAIPIYMVRTAPARLTMVTDSINAGSLFGGVGTALIFSALLAQRIGAGLRLLTRTQPPELDNLRHVLATNGIKWEGNVERAWLSGAKKRDVAVSDADVFVTTSWWTTNSVARSVERQRIIYLLQEDERMFYPFGDERVRCQETLADPDLRFVINSELLFRHLTTGPDALANIRRNGIYFEPAFPSSQYYPEPASGEARSKNSFFFYARPDHLRNLYWRGLEAVSASVEEGVLTPEEWDFYFVGRSVSNVILPGGVRPKIFENLSWAQYGALVRRMDLGLSLMDTPHPSYPPLDLAASGAVVVTNRHGLKTSLTQYSPNILCSDTTVNGLKNALREGARLAEDRATRFQNYANSHLARDWTSTLEPVVKSMAEGILRGKKSS